MEGTPIAEGYMCNYAKFAAGDQGGGGGGEPKTKTKKLFSNKKLRNFLESDFI